MVKNHVEFFKFKNGNGYWLRQNKTLVMPNKTLVYTVTIFKYFK